VQRYGMYSNYPLVFEVGF